MYQDVVVREPVRECHPLAMITCNESRQAKVNARPRSSPRSARPLQTSHVVIYIPGGPRATVITTEASASTLWIQRECAAVVVFLSVCSQFVGSSSSHFHMHCFNVAQEKVFFMVVWHTQMFHGQQSRAKRKITHLQPTRWSQPFCSSWSAHFGNERPSCRRLAVGLSSWVLSPCVAKGFPSACLSPFRELVVSFLMFESSAFACSD